MRGLSWISVDVDMPDHPKMGRLAAILGVSEAWPRVFRLWCWAAKLAPDGNLGALPDRTIAQAAGWRGNATAFVDALVEVGLLERVETGGGDPSDSYEKAGGAPPRTRTEKSGHPPPDSYRLHDWGERYGKFLERLEKDRERKRLKKEEEAPEFRRKLRGASAPFPVPRARARGSREEVQEEEEDQEQEPTGDFAPGGTSSSESGGQLPLLEAMVPVPDADRQPLEPPPRPRAPGAGADDAAPAGSSEPPPALEPDGDGVDAEARRAERVQLRADFDRWVVPARELLGLTPADSPTSPAWHVFAGRKGTKGARDRYGLERLLRSLEGLSGDAFARGAGLRGLLSDTLIQKGLSRMVERERGPSMPPPPAAPAAPAAPLPKPGERARTPWDRR